MKVNIYEFRVGSIYGMEVIIMPNNDDALFDLREKSVLRVTFMYLFWS